MTFCLIVLNKRYVGYFMLKINWEGSGDNVGLSNRSIFYLTEVKILDIIESKTIKIDIFIILFPTMLEKEPESRQ